MNTRPSLSAFKAPAKTHPRWNKSTLKNLCSSTTNSMVACRSPMVPGFLDLPTGDSPPCGRLKLSASSLAPPWQKEGREAHENYYKFKLLFMVFDFFLWLQLQRPRKNRLATKLPSSIAVLSINLLATIDSLANWLPRNCARKLCQVGDSRRARFIAFFRGCGWPSVQRKNNN